MARQARGEVFDPHEVSTWHCINRCVRRCFLCGHDPVSGKNYEHRKQWLETRFRWLAAHFGMDVLGFAILSNHFHIILRNSEDQTNGRFWQGRFRSVKLCDEAALLAFSVYVDLNPIRAGLAESPETSDFTSAQRRIDAQQQAVVASPDDLPPQHAHPEHGFLRYRWRKVPRCQVRR